MAIQKSMSGLGQRQKVIIVAIVIIFLIVIYNIVGLFRNSGTTTTPTVATTTTPAVTTPPASAPGNPKEATAASAITDQSAAANSSVRQTHVLPNLEILRLESQKQTEYMSDLSELQLLKVQRQIAETKQAIAAAKLATITAETGIADSLTVTGQGRGNVSQQQVTLNTNFTPPAPAPSINASYTLMSVSFQGKKWTAVIKDSANYVIVSVGDKLSDGSTVQSIDRAGVTIKKDNTITKLALSNAI